MSDYKPMRLIAAAKKFNVGASTITEFLQGKGFDIDNRPTTKLSDCLLYTSDAADES